MTREAPLPAVDKGVLKRLLVLAWQYRWGCVLPLSVQVVLLTLGIIGLTFTGLGLDVIARAADVTREQPRYPLGIHRFDQWSAIAQVAVIGVAILSFSAIRGVLNIINAIALAKLIQAQMVVDLRSSVYDKLQRLSFRFYDRNETGSIINRVTQDVQRVSNFVSGVVLNVIILTLSLIIYLIYMVRISPTLTLACLATTPLLWYGSLVYSRTIKALHRRNRELYDKLILVLSENLSGVHVVKGFRLQDQQNKRFRDANLDFKYQQRAIFWRTSVFGPSLHFVTQVNIAVLLGFGGYMVIKGQLAFGTGLWVFMSLLNNVSGQVQGLANLANNVPIAMVSAKRIFDVLDTPLEIQSPADAKRLPRAIGKLEFRHVSFEFEPGKPILKDISFVLEPGKTLAILGPTGAGKTVLLSLIPRFYDPSEGQILIDDVDIREYDLNDLRKVMGIVFQETFLFSNTVKANIAFGAPSASMEQIQRAAATSKAHEFVSAMPQQYDTIISEGGSNLSGGQKQRLAIARALILEPRFLLMDDPMAAVDAQTEHELVQAMDSAMQGRSTIVVANRISTLRRADMILVMQKGRIVQRGTHAQLMNMTGHYRETARLQIDEEARKAILSSSGTGVFSPESSGSLPAIKEAGR